MNEHWRQDPRLQGMNSQKLKYLADLAAQVEKTPKNKLLPLFMSISAGSSQMDFSDSETDLLVSILTADMSKEEKKKLDTLRMLSRKLGKKRSEADKKCGARRLLRRRIFYNPVRISCGRSRTASVAASRHFTISPGINTI